MRSARIHETPGRARRLGRHVVHDPRSRDFPAAKASRIISVNHAAVGLPLDQGDVGSCTGNAAVAALNSEPYFSSLQRSADRNMTARPPFTETDALTFYHLETKAHPKDGIYPPADPGGSGLWVAKVLKNLGLISGYSHAFGIEHALLALVKRPCIFGVNWYDSFDYPGKKSGLVAISPGAKVDGGHEICADAIDAENRLVWFWQSWGKWGYQNSGRFCMSFDTLDRLLQEQGDCTVFTPSSSAPA